MRAGISVLLVFLALTAGAEEVPDVIVDQDGPLWVAADVAIDAQGHLRPDRLGRFGESIERSARVAAERERARSTPLRPEECQTYFGVVPEHMTPNGSIEALTSRAHEIVTGRVVAVRQGFYGGLPGSLLRIDATYLEGSAPLETYLLYPYARIATADAPLCAKPLMGDFVPPQPGDRLLIFSMNRGKVRDGRRILQVKTNYELVHESREGLLVPKALLPYAGDRREFDAVLQAVMQRLGQ
jgi:hypothetical protein